MTAVLASLAVLALLAVAVLLYRRLHVPDAGSVSFRWIAEHRAQHDGSRSNTGS